ncbi:hypothetical protein B0J13DRAFT_182198 [Dactylonectria estremocensis]|uniref:Uncharacterized protein n=1 Tax=Dactylonectria estremocensis TaxID=1079267 RepID=A0A9P9FBU4_9HYPO|nr:hypothetical protein B0J13DRAFT_182198 [Dactylonectria estremocensis]
MPHFCNAAVLFGRAPQLLLLLLLLLCWNGTPRLLRQPLLIIPNWRWQAGWLGSPRTNQACDVRAAGGCLFGATQNVRQADRWATVSVPANVLLCLMIRSATSNSPATSSTVCDGKPRARQEKIRLFLSVESSRGFYCSGFPERTRIDRLGAQR